MWAMMAVTGILGQVCIPRCSGPAQQEYMCMLLRNGCTGPVMVASGSSSLCPC